LGQGERNDSEVSEATIKVNALISPDRALWIVSRKLSRSWHQPWYSTDIDE